MKKLTVTAASVALGVGMIVAPSLPAFAGRDNVRTARAGCALPGPIIDGHKHSLHASYAAVDWWDNIAADWGGYIYASAVKQDIVQYKTPVNAPARFLYKFWRFKAVNGDIYNHTPVYKYNNPSQWGGTASNTMLDVFDDLGHTRRVHMTAYWSTYQWSYSKKRWVANGSHPICDDTNGRNTDGTILDFPHLPQ